MESYKKVLSSVKKAVKDANDAPDNKYGPSVWAYHLEFVAFYALRLAKKLQADKQVVELAAYLHDYAALLKPENDKDHHILGAKEAQKMLLSLGYDKTRTAKIEECIMCHRGSVPMKRPTIEAKIIASADAMSHFKCLPDMFYLAYNRHNFNTKDGAIWLKSKLERSWKKIMPEGRVMIKKEKNLCFSVLKQVID